MKPSAISKIGAAALAAMALAPLPANAIVVDAEIVLLMDVSGSVDAGEFALQQTGYANAFQSAAVHAALAGTTNGVAVTLVQWSGAGQQAQSVGWTHLTNAASSNAFGAAIAGMGRAFNGLTAIGDALNFGTGLFGTETGGGSNGFESARQVIDVSGDGATNDGVASSTGRANALGAGVDVINGIVILGETGLLTHYQTQVIGGTNNDGSPAFVLQAANFASFETAITQKLAAEVTGGGIPEPMSMALFGLGLAGMGFVARRRRA